LFAERTTTCGHRRERALRLRAPRADAPPDVGDGDDRFGCGVAYAKAMRLPTSAACIRALS